MGRPTCGSRRPVAFWEQVSGGKKPAILVQSGPNKKTDLNTASSEELAELPGIGPDKAWDLIQHRPYARWEDVERVPGLSREAIEVMKRNGASIQT